MNKYKIGFWNYVQTGTLDTENSANDWANLGMNMPMSFEFDSQKHKKEQMIEQLDACEKRNMKLIVCDSRTTFKRYLQVGEDSFRKGVVDASKDFAEHPAFFGFHVGDEPLYNQWDAAKRAYIICKESAPKIMPFINFLPYWDEDDFINSLGVTNDKYEEKLDNFLMETGAKKIGYDYYGHCSYFERERYIDVYFRNLNIFNRVAKKNDADLYVSLLSVGHWSLCVPDEDLMRWQISTAIAHGAIGLMWFFIYERTLDGSFRLSPIDLFWEKTETYNRLSRQNRTFMQYFVPELSRLKFDSVSHFGKSYGGTPLFENNSDLSIKVIVNEVPLSVTKFSDENGENSYSIVNLSQTQPTAIFVTCSGELKHNTMKYWLAPGQMQLLLKK